jgi:uncharacterized protein (TIGR02145 family)
MSKIKVLWTLRMLALTGIAIFGCSDSGGSEAEEAKETVGLTSDGHDVLVYNKGDLEEVLFKIDTVQITDTNFIGKLFFRDLPENKIPEPGDIISSYITENAPHGFLFRVKDVATESEGVTVVSVGYASIADAIKDLDIEIVIPIAYEEETDSLPPHVLKLGNPFKYVYHRAVDGVKWIGGVTGISNLTDAANYLLDKANDLVSYTYHQAKDAWDELVTIWKLVFQGKLDYENIPVGETLKVNKIGKDFGNGNKIELNGECAAFIKVKIKIQDYNLKLAQISVAQNLEMSLTGNFKGRIGINEEILLLAQDLPTLTFNVGIPIIITNEAFIRARIEANAQTNMSADLYLEEYSEHGVKYENSRFDLINTHGHKYNFSYRHSTHGEVKLGVLVGAKSMLYGFAGLDFSIGPSMKLKSPQLPLSANSRTSLDLDLDGYLKTKLYLPFGIIDKEWGVASLHEKVKTLASTKTLPSFDFERLNFELGEISKGELAFPFAITEPELAFSAEEFGFCMEAKAGECIKGPGIGFGRFGRVTISRIKFENVGQVTDSRIKFEGLTPGTYTIIPYIKSYNGEIYYDMAKAVSFTIDNYCGDVAYDSKLRFCFNNQLYDLCSGNSYNPPTHFCFEDVVYSKCNSSTYNPSISFCFNYQLYDLCGGNSYNPQTQFCFNNVAYARCSGNTYNPTVNFCFNNALYDLCGGNSYNPQTQFCFNKTAYPRCGGNVYDPSEGEMCCGTIVYNTKMQRCSGDVIADKEGGFVNDAQGYRYGVAKIGDQYWMAENLNIDVPRSRCYDDDPINCRIYGRLYDWAAAMNLPESCNTVSCADQINKPHQGICPDGWHIPTLAEWNKLILFAEGNDNLDTTSFGIQLVAQRKLFAASPLWHVYYTGGGTDDFGFSALPGGAFTTTGYGHIQGTCFFWGATEGVSRYDESPNSYNEFAVSKNSYRSDSYGSLKIWAFSVRCIKD